MGINKILLLGNPKLYEVSDTVKKKEIPNIPNIIEELHQALMEFRSKYSNGRAISAPQIGILKRIIYMNIDKPVVFINPVLFDLSQEQFEIWDDCMSFPDILVRVKRHKSCKMRYLDENWKENTIVLQDSLSELIQHEYDHLNGILSTMIAVDKKAFRLKANQI